MPTTLIALIILVFAVFPGYPAYKLYKTINGFDWRISDIEKIVVIIGFSIFGLVFYILLSEFLNLPSPIYVFPTTFSNENFTNNVLSTLAISFLGHFLSSSLISIALASIIRLISKKTRFVGLTSAWDLFYSQYSSEHWVVVRVKNGETYAGILDYVNTAVSQGDRDVILKEPALFSDEDKNYRAIEYEYLFLPANIVISIGIVCDPQKDKRITQFNDLIFPEREKNDQ